MSARVYTVRCMRTSRRGIDCRPSVRYSCTLHSLRECWRRNGNRPNEMNPNASQFPFFFFYDNSSSAHWWTPLPKSLATLLKLHGSNLQACDENKLERLLSLWNGIFVTWPWAQAPWFDEQRPTGKNGRIVCSNLSLFTEMSILSNNVDNSGQSNRVGRTAPPIGLGPIIQKQSAWFQTLKGSNRKLILVVV